MRGRKLQFKPKKTGKREYGVAVWGFKEPLGFNSKLEPIGLLTAISGSDAETAKKEIQALCDLLNQAQDAFYHGVRAADLVQRVELPVERESSV